MLVQCTDVTAKEYYDSTIEIVKEQLYKTEKDISIAKVNCKKGEEEIKRKSKEIEKNKEKIEKKKQKTFAFKSL